ncbi:MAG TPA: YbhB/YbcL family Raf kinase inhibitor-like protein [Gemmatimonadales bacterium]|nr:YbhB/YbcL family Raf kinase inhibitor-like protein [Gemmatimonadales bacterium]
MLILRSSAFEPDAPIPARHTCDGPDLSPPLSWSGAPPETRSFALIVDDPDSPDPAAPKRIWVHWLLYNIPADQLSLSEGAGNHDGAPAGEHARTDANRPGYHGPCPPIGRHRYFFRLAALDALLPSLGPRARRADLEQAMEGHVLATAVLMGTYARPGR